MSVPSIIISHSFSERGIAAIIITFSRPLRRTSRRAAGRPVVARGRTGGARRSGRRRRRVCSRPTADSPAPCPPCSPPTAPVLRACPPNRRLVKLLLKPRENVCRGHFLLLRQAGLAHGPPHGREGGTDGSECEARSHPVFEFESVEPLVDDRVACWGINLTPRHREHQKAPIVYREDWLGAVALFVYREVLTCRARLGSSSASSAAVDSGRVEETRLFGNAFRNTADT